MQLYLLVMEGQGDTHTKLVTQNVWDWIQRTDTPGRENDDTGWEDTATPESVLKALRKERSSAFVTSGSFTNDRALLACGDEVPFDEYGGPEDVVSARKWAKKNGHVIVDEWEGYIY